MVLYRPSLTWITVEFEMVVFRPFKHEVILARITHQTEEGIYREFQPAILVTQDMPNTYIILQLAWTSLAISSSQPRSYQTTQSCKYQLAFPIASLRHSNKILSDTTEKVWVWKEDGQELYFDNNEMVRFRVIGEEWHDQTPTGPVEVDQAANQLLPPYKITGSMKEGGLGCCLWWE